MPKLAILAGVVAASSSLAHAQVSTGTNISGKESASPVQTIGAEVDRELTPMEAKAHAEAVRVGRLMAACVTKRRPETVAEILSSRNVDQFNVGLKKLQPTMSPCLVTAAGGDAMMTHLRLAPFDLMGWLAEAALVRAPAPVFETVPIAAVPRAPQWITFHPGRLAMMQIASCLAHTQPERAEAIVWSQPGTPQEAAAFAGIMPFLPACLDKNVTLKASKPSLRHVLATALYQRKINPTPVAPPSRAKSGNF